MNAGPFVSRQNFARQFVSLVAVFCLIATLQPLAAADFVRGDVNGDSQLNTGDMVTVLNFLAGNPTTFAGCAANEFESADINDNEYFTVADFMLLTSTLFSLPPPSSAFPAIPAPTTCGADPTTTTDGFESIDPNYQIRLTPYIGGNEVRVFVDVRNITPIYGVQFTLDLGEGVTVGTPQRSSSVFGAIVQLPEGQHLRVALFSSDSDTGVNTTTDPADPNDFQSLGVLSIPIRHGRCTHVAALANYCGGSAEPAGTTCADGEAVFRRAS